ncbi:MAG: penicillin-binding protein, partial [Acidimicrobiales bacterium]|nr:penicillin-binding protein [Acidimicrobiales bacterium]
MPRRAKSPRRKRSILWRTRNIFLVMLLLFVAAAAGMVSVFWNKVELPEASPVLAETTYICSSEVTGTCTADNSIAQLSGGEDRELVTYEEIPQVLIDAVLATEDKDFFEHKGVDPVGVARAFWSNVTSEDGELSQGGSTITQQYVKNVFLTQERTFDRKTREAVMALKLERELPKKEILERYLNTIYFGRGAYGVSAASRDYFGKDLAQIGLPEAAYLAGIIRAPEAADANLPSTDPKAAAQREAATERRSQVLGQMLTQGKITQAEHDLVDDMGWDYVVERSTGKNFGNVKHSELGSEYFIEYVRQWLLRQDVFPVTDAEIYGGGLRVYTTIDWNAQAKAYEAIFSELNRPDDPAASIVAVDHDGNVRAMVGGFDWNASQVNLAAGAEGGGSGRQPGSSFKTFALVSALEQGMSLGQYYNAPGRMKLNLAGGEVWDVGNYGDAGLGTLDLVESTVRSSNTAYAQLALDVGASNIVETAHRMGVTGSLPEFPAVVLGTGSVSVLDMAAGYSTLAAEGMKVGPHVVSKVT